jgi:hypothetical protein
MQTLIEGDLFEKSQADWIRATLPIYEEVWREFIGHDGHGHPRMGFRDEASEIAKKHAMFCQSHYSMALFLFLFDRSTQESIAYLKEIPTNRPITSAHYLKLTQNTSTFLALLGQVCDMVEAIAAAVGADYIRDPIRNLMLERNQSIHGARIPLGMNYAGVYFAKIALRDGEPGYQNRLAWASVPPTEFRYIEDWFEDSRRRLIGATAREVLPAIQSNARRQFRDIQDLTPVAAQQTRATFENARSLDTASTAISGGMNLPQNCSSS